MENCPICLVKIDKIYTLPCKHNFHYLCITEWANRNNSCPMCRQKIRENKEFYIPNIYGLNNNFNFYEDGIYDSEEESTCDSDTEQEGIDYGNESDFEEECRQYPKAYNPTFRASDTVLIYLIPNF